MSVADVGGIIGGAAGIFAALTAVYGLRVAIGANEIANRGNKLAKSANVSAVDALREAEEANRIAVDANKLAAGANSIAERALRVTQDDIPYNWSLKVEDDGSAAVVNDCGHRALQVTIVIDVDGKVLADSDGPQDVEPFGTVDFDVASAMAKHYEEVRKYPYRYAHSGNGYFAAGGPNKTLSTRFRAHLRWTTEDEVPRSDVIDEVVSHFMGADRLPKRVEPEGTRSPRKNRGK